MMAHYDRAVEINSGFIQAGGNDGRSWKSGGADGSIANNKRITVIDPFNAVVYYNRGLARYKKGDMDGAVADLNRAVAITPRNAAAYTVRGAAPMDKGDIKGAE